MDIKVLVGGKLCRAEVSKDKIIESELLNEVNYFDSQLRITANLFYCFFDPAPAANAYAPDVLIRKNAIISQFLNINPQPI
jgi:hypothetical protein